MVRSVTHGGQASLEVTLAMLGTLLLFFGCVKVFVWVAGGLAQRQYNYDVSRAMAADADAPIPSIPYEPQPLRVFEGP